MVQLTDKQLRFVEQYVVDFNATQAAIRAGYSAHTAKQQGSRLLTRVDVRKALAGVARAQQVEAERRMGRTILTGAEVLAEAAKIAMFNIGRVIRVTPGGDPLIDLSEADADDLAA